MTKCRLCKKIQLISLLMFVYSVEELRAMQMNPYQILGISLNANEFEIKKAYRKQAKLYHPDKNKDIDTSEKFMKVNEAYEILSDPIKKSNYDRFGNAYFGNVASGPGGGGFHNFDFDQFFRNFDDFGFQSDINSRGRQRQQNGRQRLNINLDEMLSNGFGFFGSHGSQANNPHRHHFGFGDDGHDEHVFGGGNSFFGSHFNGGHHTNGGGQNQGNCRTFFQKVGNTVVKMTNCS